MKENLKKIECFEMLLQILSFCMNKWRKRSEVIEYLGLNIRTGLRHIKQLIEAGFMEEKNGYVGATSKAYKMLINGVDL